MDKEIDRKQNNLYIKTKEKWIERQIDRHKNRQTVTQKEKKCSNKWIKSQIYRQTDIQIDRNSEIGRKILR